MLSRLKGEPPRFAGRFPMIPLKQRSFRAAGNSLVVASSARWLSMLFSGVSASFARVGGGRGRQRWLLQERNPYLEPIIKSSGIKCQKNRSGRHFGNAHARVVRVPYPLHLCSLGTFLVPAIGAGLCPDVSQPIRGIHQRPQCRAT